MGGLPRARKLAMIASAVAVLAVCAVAGYVLGAPHRNSPLRRTSEPTQVVHVGALLSPVSIPRCVHACAPAP